MDATAQLRETKHLVWPLFHQNTPLLWTACIHSLDQQNSTEQKSHSFTWTFKMLIAVQTE